MKDNPQSLRSYIFFFHCFISLRLCYCLRFSSLFCFLYFMSSVSFTGSYSDDVPKQIIINCCFCIVMNVISEYYYDYFLYCRH